ncbi:MAG: GGDEF domain-containing protein [Burkholderiales bacterium]|nr:GGDEF domain-containing protein [Burkholderiales bacterium]
MIADTSATPLRSPDRLHDVLDSLPALVGHFDKHQRCLFANQRALAVHGLTQDQVVGMSFRDGVSAETYATHKGPIEQVLRGRPVSFEGYETALDAYYQVHLVPEFDSDKQVVGFFLMTFNVTPLKKAQIELEESRRRMSELALVDQLTGLPNRRSFQQHLPEALARSRRQGEPLALLFLDVDRFKQVNDHHGHAVGDLVLQRVAERLRHGLRETDFPARLAGDEFVAVLEGVHTVQQMAAVAQKLVHALGEPVVLPDGAALAVSVSMGAALVPPQSHDTPDAILAGADGALYQAKAQGRGRCHATVLAPQPEEGAAPHTPASAHLEQLLVESPARQAMGDEVAAQGPAEG